MDHRHPGHSLALRRVLDGCDGMAVAGGLIQSETSPWNIPFHTSRLRAAVRAGCPITAIGMGVGEVRGALGRGLSRRSLRRLQQIIVRDAGSARRLGSMGIDGVVVGADPVIALEPQPVEATDTMCVILRPANRRGLRTAAGKARKAARKTEAIERIARSIDEAVTATGLAPRFVSFQAGRDGPLHEAVAQRLSTSAEVVTPTVNDILSEVGRSRFVVTMRYHGAVAALLYNRPAVMIGYSPKMASLAGEGGGWAPVVDLDSLESDSLKAAVDTASRVHSRALQARDELRSRLAANDSALDELVAGGA